MRKKERKVKGRLVRQRSGALPGKRMGKQNGSSLKLFRETGFTGPSKLRGKKGKTNPATSPYGGRPERDPGEVGSPGVAIPQKESKTPLVGNKIREKKIAFDGHLLYFEQKLEKDKGKKNRLRRKKKGSFSGDLGDFSKDKKPGWRHA